MSDCGAQGAWVHGTSADIGIDGHGDGVDSETAEGGVLKGAAIGRFETVGESLDTTPLRRERVGCVEEALDPVGEVTTGGFERVGDQVAGVHTCRVQLATQYRCLERQHCRVDDVGLLTSRGHFVGLGGEVHVVDRHEVVVVNHRAATGLKDFSEDFWVVPEIRPRGREGHRGAPTPVEGEFCACCRLGRVVEGDEEGQSLGISERRLGRGHEQNRNLAGRDLQ